MSFMYFDRKLEKGSKASPTQELVMKSSRFIAHSRITDPTVSSNGRLLLRYLGSIVSPMHLSIS